jgi:pimeloyl-ACP methyl ester carboxylesterase
MFSNFVYSIVSIAAIAGMTSVAQAAVPAPSDITIVLVHGAFAESSSWDEVIPKLVDRGYSVVAVANPLRGLRTDSDYVASVLGTIKGPIVLVGHSYGGSVITNAAVGHNNVKALVYVDGTAPDMGETTAGLSGQFPGGTLGPALATPVPLPDGNRDLYIMQEKYRSQFAADVSAAQAALMFATQRPVTEAALHEASGPPAWKAIPSWFIYGELDKNIPPAAHEFMAKRAGAKEIVQVKTASHVVMISHPDDVAQLIDRAAQYPRKEAAMNKSASKDEQIANVPQAATTFNPAPVVPLANQAPARQPGARAPRCRFAALRAACQGLRGGSLSSGKPEDPTSLRPGRTRRVTPHRTPSHHRRRSTLALAGRKR